MHVFPIYAVLECKTTLALRKKSDKNKIKNKQLKIKIKKLDNILLLNAHAKTVLWSK